MRSLVRETLIAYGRLLVRCWPALLVVLCPVACLNAALAFGGVSDRTAWKVDNLLGSVFGILAVATALRFLGAEREGVRKSCWKLLIEAALCWGRLFKTNLIVGLIGLLLLVCLVVPGVIWFVFYAFTSCCVVIEGLKAHDAMSESKRLVKGAWWQTFGVFVSLFLIYLFFSYAVLFCVELGVSALESACGDEEFLPNWFCWVYAVKEFACGLAGDVLYLFVVTGGALFYFRRKAELSCGADDSSIACGAQIVGELMR